MLQLRKRESFTQLVVNELPPFGQVHTNPALYDKWWGVPEALDYGPARAGADIIYYRFHET